MVISRLWHTISFPFKEKKDQNQIMEECQLSYIPERLHKKDKPIIDYFDIGEFLYRRCNPDELANPFKSISITELSHNRGGLTSQPLCNPSDVLYSINPNENFERYSGKVVCTLVIKSLKHNKTFKKKYTQEKDNQVYTCFLELFHDPVSCMYPHCVFRVVINEEVITYDNYKNTLGKLSQIRNELKEELASMIIQREVNQDDIPNKE